MPNNKLSKSVQIKRLIKRIWSENIVDAYLVLIGKKHGAYKPNRLKIVKKQTPLPGFEAVVEVPNDNRD